jgi:hypothetical protein
VSAINITVSFKVPTNDVGAGAGTAAATAAAVTAAADDAVTFTRVAATVAAAVAATDSLGNNDGSACWELKDLYGAPALPHGARLWTHNCARVVRFSLMRALF